jgi:luciferase family oxidoreductase group 1
VRASILDIQPPIFLPDVVAVAEEAGYHRYWATEHHGPRQSASPTLAIGLAAGVSQRLRIGMGGALLRIHSPRRIAADVGLLRTFFPGRIDVGIAGAVPPGGVAEAFGGPAADDATYRRRIEELAALLADPDASCAALVEDEPPPLWLCGTSERSARVAGELGLGFAFHVYLAPRGDAYAVGQAYRDSFRPRPGQPTPYFAIAGYGAVDDELPAAANWGLGMGEHLSPTFAGTIASCADQIGAAVARTGADEIFLDCFAQTIEARVAALRDLAAALGLGDRKGRT